MVIVLLLTVTLPLAASGTYTVTLCDGEKTPQILSGEASYVLPSCESAAGMVFAGWITTEGDGEKLYPAGATVTPDRELTFSAFYLRMSVQKPELRVKGREDMGIRFLTAVNKADYTRLATVSSVEFGTLVAPNGKMNTAIAGTSKSIDIPAGEFYKENGETLLLAGSVNAILAKNSTRDLLGVGYFTITYADGSVSRIYAVHDVACRGRFYPMLVAAQEGTTDDGTRELIAEKLAAVVSVTEDVSGGQFVAAAGSTAFDVCREDGADWEFRIVLTVKDGEDFRFDRDMWVCIRSGAALTGSTGKTTYQISEDGKTLTIFSEDGTDNY